ncbi:probable D-2-hydroxyacid dehydrogenase [Natronomonas moolapensis 8.8.11]|uniref:Probable D-2-hydroxyacid dehydrogenase n=1 Tax=Natronomonas moolapensis (strain DSM 18674 / CECT 7526 / JCM 14361 / 8.8.11) TaxID=268739 RepID=M1XQI6_NATM8|nr:D-2-hydroxyacid dehydrogenase [Natronomonas moolapensis]CCQ36396.1 probable D-2-hydroxyacid dehydrogenase [Natronomonas moolapensis 8.8.11]
MELLVLREGVHGLPAESYAGALAERLPGHTVKHATTPDAERELIPDADVATGLDVRSSILADADSLRVFACAYAGTDHLPLDALAEHDIAVTNAAGVHTPNAAEQAIGSMLAFSRRLHEAARADSWQPVSPGELAGSTVTIVGLGAIGTGIAERLDPFGVTTVGVRRRPESGGPTDEVIGPERLQNALARSEFVVLCCPLTESTRGLVDAEALATLPPDAVLVNVARGEVIETEALVESLRRGWIGGAVLDVTDPEPLPDDHPLWGIDDVLITPHSAGATPNYYGRLADIVADNVGRLKAGETLRNRVRLRE